MMKMMRNTLVAAALIGAQAVMFSAPAAAADKVCKLALAANDMMQYDKKDLSVAADCTQVELTLTHTGKLPKEAMGHNFVLVKPDDQTAVANAGMAAGPQNNYIQSGDKRVIAHTKLVGGGESATVTFPTAGLQKGVAYNFLCTFPGHSALMHGTFKFG